MNSEKVADQVLNIEMKKGACHLKPSFSLVTIEQQGGRIFNF